MQSGSIDENDMATFLATGVRTPEALDSRGAGVQTFSYGHIGMCCGLDELQGYFNPELCITLQHALTVLLPAPAGPITLICN
jgi:hypothetical protein